MAYVAPSTRTTGDLITASIWNSDVVANPIALYAGAMSIASQAAEDLILASSATQLKRLAKTNLGVLVTNGSGVAAWLAGSASQYLRLNAGATAFEFATLAASPLVLLGQAEGTNTTASATNVATVAISGLTTKDRLWVLGSQETVTQQTASPNLYNSTDSVTIFDPTLDFAAADYGRIDVQFGPTQLSSTTIIAAGNMGKQNNAAAIAPIKSTFSTDWTGSWTLALRTGVGGVTSGGTYRYRFAVYKITGQ